jgi:formylglycine-generating enzyme required for sulfatase activity
MRPLLVLLALGSGGVVQSGRTIVAERPLASMVSIPAGTFTMGATDEQRKAAVTLCRDELGPKFEKICDAESFAREGPDRTVWLSAFHIDRVEVTVQAYRACVQAGACSPQPLLQPDERFLRPELPITSVTADEAEQYCRWRGARLPTEAEWERAARGRDGRTWPWGNRPSASFSNHGKLAIAGELSPMPYAVLQPDPSDGYTFLAPVGSFPQGASADGVLDLSGNASEWTADYFGEEPPQKLGTVNPRGPREGAMRVVRGGSWRQPRMFQRTTSRDGLPVDTRSSELGFRCAR